MTYLELVNRVLRGLRQDQVAAVTGEYPLLIGQLVNEAKQDLEDLGPWDALRQTFDISLADAEFDSVLTGTNPRSYLEYRSAGPGEPAIPQAFRVTSGNEGYLAHVSDSRIRAYRNIFPDQQTAIPCEVSLTRSDDELTANFWPASLGAHDFRLFLIVPQAELVLPDDEILVPAEPVWREALVRAGEERGEEFSGSLESMRQRALEARWAAVMRDFGARDQTFEAV